MNLASKLICTALLICAAPSAVFAAQIGTVAAVVGSPSASGPGGDRSLKAGSAVFEDDKVTVGFSGNAQIVLDDGTKLVVGPSSSLVLEQYLRRGSNSAKKITVKALRGTFRFITGKSAKSAYDIRTANATIGIRGTGFDFWVKSRTGVAVLVGTVRISGNGSAATVSAGCGVAIAGGGQRAAVLDGLAKANGIRNNLPYVIDQRRLQPAFRLPIQNCRSALAVAEPSGGGGDERTTPRSRQTGNTQGPGNSPGPRKP